MSNVIKTLTHCLIFVLKATHSEVLILSACVQQTCFG